MQASSEALEALGELRSQDILLPALAISNLEEELTEDTLSDSYHDAVVAFSIDGATSLEDAIRSTVDRYLQLPSERKFDDLPLAEVADDEQDKRLFLLSLQQQRLTEKLQERLDYLGVYYKRNPQNFARSMTAEDSREFFDKLRQDYQQIILSYFANDSSINQRIDDFVNVAFFADVSVPQIVEIHMELIDDFSKQLQLEGRNDGILADYRLTLIDVIAHLCEMYRRSIHKDL